MSQLPLYLPRRLAYEPDNFIEHSGVAGDLKQACSLLLDKAFAIIFFKAQARSGKTHLSIKLADLLVKAGLYPRLVDASEFPEWLGAQNAAGASSNAEIIIVDDAHQYFSALEPGESGPFVSFIEKLRHNKGSIVFLSDLPIEDFPCDEHAKSRLLPGEGFSIDPPAEEEVSLVISSVAKQRGILLSSRQVEFIRKRIGRDIESIENYLNRVDSFSSISGQPIKRQTLVEAL